MTPSKLRIFILMVRITRTTVHEQTARMMRNKIALKQRQMDQQANHQRKSRLKLRSTNDNGRNQKSKHLSGTLPVDGPGASTALLDLGSNSDCGWLGIAFMISMQNGTWKVSTSDVVEQVGQPAISLPSKTTAYLLSKHTSWEAGYLAPRDPNDGFVG